MKLSVTKWNDDEDRWTFSFYPYIYDIEVMNHKQTSPNVK